MSIKTFYIYFCMSGFVQIENKIDSILQKLEQNHSIRMCIGQESDCVDPSLPSTYVAKTNRFFTCFKKMDKVLSYLSQHNGTWMISEVRDGVWRVSCFADGQPCMWISLTHQFNSNVVVSWGKDNDGQKSGLENCTIYVGGYETYDHRDVDVIDCAKEIDNVNYTLFKSEIDLMDFTEVKKKRGRDLLTQFCQEIRKTFKKRTKLNPADFWCFDRECFKKRRFERVLYDGEQFQDMTLLKYITSLPENGFNDLVQFVKENLQEIDIYNFTVPTKFQLLGESDVHYDSTGIFRFKLNFSEGIYIHVYSAFIEDTDFLCTCLRFGYEMQGLHPCYQKMHLILRFLECRKFGLPKIEEIKSGTSDSLHWEWRIADSNNQHCMFIKLAIENNIGSVFYFKEAWTQNFKSTYCTTAVNCENVVMWKIKQGADEILWDFTHHNNPNSKISNNRD